MAGGSGWPGSSLAGKAAGGSIILATIAIYPLFGPWPSDGDMISPLRVAAGGPP